MDIKEFIKKINDERKNFHFVDYGRGHYLLMVYPAHKQLCLVKDCLYDDYKQLCIKNSEKMLFYFGDFLNKNYPQYMHLLSGYSLNYFEDER